MPFHQREELRCGTVAYLHDSLGGSREIHQVLLAFMNLSLPLTHSRVPPLPHNFRSHPKYHPRGRLQTRREQSSQALCGSRELLCGSGQRKCEGRKGKEGEKEKETCEHTQRHRTTVHCSGRSSWASKPVTAFHQALK